MYVVTIKQWKRKRWFTVHICLFYTITKGQNLECKVCLYYLLLVGKYIFVQNSERHYHYQKVLKLVKTKDYTIKQELCFVINTFLWKLENKVIDTRQTVSFGEKLRHTHNFIHANNLYTCTIVKQKMWQKKFF